MARHFYVAVNISGLERACIGPTIRRIKVENTHPQNTSFLSDVSFARSVYIPKKSAEFSLLDGNEDVVFFQGEYPEYASHITIDLLAQMVDLSQEYWDLVSCIIGSLGLDVTLLRYRSNAASYPPVILHAFSDTIETWFGYHGYLMSDFAGNLMIFKKNDKLAMVYIDSRPMQKKIENVPVEVLNVRETYGGSEIPLFFAMEGIDRLEETWKARPTNTWPCTKNYFNLAQSINDLYVRYVPVEDPGFRVPTFIPGPAFYAQKNAPHTALAGIFGRTRFFRCVRESHHSNPIMPCMSEIYKMAD